MLRFLSSPFRWAVQRLGPDQSPEEQPLLPGFRRAPSSRLIFLLLALLFVVCAVQGYTFAAVAPARVMPFLAPIAILGMLVIWALPHGDYAPTRVMPR